MSGSNCKPLASRSRRWRTFANWPPGAIRCWQAGPSRLARLGQRARFGQHGKVFDSAFGLRLSFGSRISSFGILLLDTLLAPTAFWAMVAPSYEQSKNRSESPLRSTRRAGHLLLVLVRRVQDPAVLRRVAQGHRLQPVEGGPHRSQDRRLVRLQTLRQQTLLRRRAQPVALAAAARRSPGRDEPTARDRPAAGGGWLPRRRRLGP